MPIITISGPLGARPREIGARVAEILDIDYLDQAIIVDASKRLGVPVDVMALREEHVTSRGERFAGVLRNFLERSATAGAGDPFIGNTGLEVLLTRSYDELAEAPRAGQGSVDEGRYAATITSILNELASKGNILIAGRGGQVVLKDLPTALHCLCVAPLEDRVSWIMEREHVSQQAATSQAKDHEKGWAGFHRSVFKADVYDNKLYDLIINTGRLPLEATAEAIASAATQKEKQVRQSEAKTTDLE